MKNLVVFLGNPGSQYKKTRHNTGWLFADTLSFSEPWKEKFHSLYTKDGETVYLKPQTFMNESGRSVQEASSFFNIDKNNILVVHDDIEKPQGNIVLEKSNALHGHNGLRSIAKELGSADFYKLRIGVGRPQNQDVASYVLGHFSELELSILNECFQKAEKEILQPFTEGRR